jgi:hypothetical protein
MYVYYNWGSGWTFAQAISSSTVASGTIDIADVLKSLEWNGVITGHEYLSEVQFGAEVVNGSRKLHINSLSYSPKIAATISGTSGDDTINMPTTGGRHVDGGAGADTVVYTDAYSNYEWW